MKISEKEYQEMSKQASPGSPVGLDCLKAFAFGGTICTLGEILFQLIRNTGLAEKETRLTVSAALILLAVVLTGFQVFDSIAKHAGAGTLVPITGFANAVAAPAIEFRSEGLVLGVGVNMFKIAGPVILYGLLASTLYGVICYIRLLL